MYARGIGTLELIYQFLSICFFGTIYGYFSFRPHFNVDLSVVFNLGSFPSSVHSVSLPKQLLHRKIYPWFVTRPHCDDSMRDE
jgi:hypothetical protein